MAVSSSRGGRRGGRGARGKRPLQKPRFQGPRAILPDPHEGHERSAAEIKRTIRSTQRLLARDGLPDEIRAKKQAQLDDLIRKESEMRLELKSKKLDRRYKHIRFFEERKIRRRITQLEKSKAEGNELTSEQAELLHQLGEDLEYVVNFPRHEKYVALFPLPAEEAKEDINARRAELRLQIKAELAAAAAKKQEWALLTEGDEGRSAASAARPHVPRPTPSRGMKAGAVELSSRAVGSGRGGEKEREELQSGGACAITSMKRARAAEEADRSDDEDDDEDEADDMDCSDGDVDASARSVDGDERSEPESSDRQDEGGDGKQRDIDSDAEVEDGGVGGGDAALLVDDPFFLEGTGSERLEGACASNLASPREYSDIRHPHGGDVRPFHRDEGFKSFLHGGRGRGRGGRNTAQLEYGSGWASGRGGGRAGARGGRKGGARGSGRGGEDQWRGNWDPDRGGWGQSGSHRGRGGLRARGLDKGGCGSGVGGLSRSASHPDRRQDGGHSYRKVSANATNGYARGREGKCGGNVSEKQVFKPPVPKKFETAGLRKQSKNEGAGRKSAGKKDEKVPLRTRAEGGRKRRKKS